MRRYLSIAWRRAVRFGALAVAAVLAVAMASSCSNKKNTAASRNYQAFITRYNVYFNGDQHYKETLKEMERAYEDDYTGRVLMHPAEAYGVEGAPTPSGSFTRSIEKAQKAIQLHSIKKRPKRKAGKGNDEEYKKWLKREEYNPFLHNAWMMMGRSQYHGGDFLGAASTFYYVAKHFWWLPATVTEARLWQARSYCALDWLYEAETILTRIKPDELTSGSLKELYDFSMADWLIRSHRDEEALPYLTEAARKASGAQRHRLYFLLGQTYAALGRKAEAYKAYGKATGSGAAFRTAFNARIRQSEVYEGDDITPEVKALRRMTRYGSNREYLDQIYYAIGNLYLSRRDTVNAIENYEKAVEKSTRGGIDKAIAQVALGGLYYDLGRYDKAQEPYSAGVSQLPQSYPGYEMMRRRSDVLDELAVYTNNVVLNDSLLRLAAMAEPERLAVIDRIIEDLKKREKKEAEDAAREEYLAEQEARGNNLDTQGNAPTEFTLNTDKSWYFYNTATRNAGRTEFQKRWGSRKLEPDWRRRNKTTFSLDAESDADADLAQDDDGFIRGDAPDPLEDDEAKETRRREQDPHFREYYIKQIPMTEAEKVTAREVIQEGLYNTGLILKDRLDDFAGASAEWRRLMTDYPENVYRLDVYYNEYLMAMRRGDTALGEQWRRRILDEFADTPQGQAMADPDYLDNLRRMETVQNSLYEQAYEDYLDNRNEAVHRAYARINEEFPMSPLMPNFMFLDALAYVTENQPTEFARVIADLLQRYPMSQVSPMASAWLTGLGKGRELHATQANTRGMLWDIRLTNDSTATAGGGADLEFTLEPDEPHYLVLLFSTDLIAPNRLLYEVARHNFNTYVVRDFDLETMNFGPLGLLIVKGFQNERELNHYRSLLARDDSFTLPSAVRPVLISRSNFEKLLQGAGSFDDYFRFIGEETDREIHESVLPPDEYPSAEEMYHAPEEAEEQILEELQIEDPQASQPTVEEPVIAPAPKAQPSQPAPDYPLGSEGDEEDE